MTTDCFPGGFCRSIWLVTLAAWRRWDMEIQPGIYQFDFDFMSALSDTLITGDMPSEVLYRLPEWCIYIETNGRTFATVSYTVFGRIRVRHQYWPQRAAAAARY